MEKGKWVILRDFKGQFGS